MRTLTLLLAALPLAATAAWAADRDRGPGMPGQRQGGVLVYPARDFDAVTLGGAANVEVRTGANWSVRAEGPAEALANLRVDQRNGTLEIGRRYEGGNWNPAERRVVVRVTMPRLAALSLGGSGRIAVDRVAGDSLKADLGGSGSIAIAQMRVERADVNLGGSGSVRASGTARQLTISMGGSGEVDAAGLHAGRAQVSMAGSGSVRAAVDGPAQVSMVGSGVVDLGAGARCEVSKMGSGTVRCGR